MDSLERCVSLHPYFKAHAGKLEEVKILLRDFVAKTSNEPAALYYEFTLNEDEIFCREGYVGAEGALAHLENVGALLEQMLTLASLTRLEIHGPAEEIAKLKGPLGKLNPAWFVYECGVQR